MKKVQSRPHKNIKVDRTKYISNIKYNICDYINYLYQFNLTTLDGRYKYKVYKTQI